MAENAPFCAENFEHFLTPAALTMRAAGTIFCTPTFQMKVTPLARIDIDTRTMGRRIQGRVRTVHASLNTLLSDRIRAYF